MKKCFLIFLILWIGNLNLSGQNPEHFQWLVGTWQGPGFGGTFEETWSEPDINGQMMGMFRFTNPEGEVQFYEYWVLSEQGLKLRHFNPDFTAWEAKGDFVNFEMIETTPDKITLKGLSYERIGEDQVKISLRMKQGDAVKTEVFNLKKVKD